MKKILFPLLLILILPFLLASCEDEYVFPQFEEPDGCADLAFEYNADTASYAVDGLGNCTCTELTVPSHYRGKPVTAFRISPYDTNTGLVSVTIPKTVTSISGSFAACADLFSLTVDEDNETYYSEGNCILYKSTKKLAVGCKASVIPSDVTAIGSSAFENCTAITELSLPSQITAIGKNAFAGCTSLTTLTLPEGVTEISDAAFAGCTSLTALTLPQSLTVLGADAFMDCSNVRSLAFLSSAKEPTVAISSFDGCKAIATLTLGKEVSSVSWLTSSSWEALTTVTVEAGNESFYAEGNCLVESATKTLVFGCNASTVPQGIAAIADYAFLYCEDLKTVTIPEGVTAIGKHAFEGCKGLTSITLPKGITEIGENTFASCESLVTITLPDGVTAIRKSAFDDCKELTSISIPGTVSVIEKYSFDGCKSLTSVTFGGTAEAWETLTKEAGVTLRKGVTVYCTDGDIVIE